jgi:hypothetical protein
MTGAGRSTLLANIANDLNLQFNGKFRKGGFFFVGTALKIICRLARILVLLRFRSLTYLMRHWYLTVLWRFHTKKIQSSGETPHRS